MDASQSIFGRLNTETHWYALKARYRHEKRVNERLQQKGVNSYLPLFTTYHQWSDRTKKVTSPLFSCYLFVHIALKDRMPVLKTDGAVHLVSFNGIPAPIPENQIHSIRKILYEEFIVEKVDYFVKGQKVEVIYGPLKGIKGIVKQIKNKTRLILSVDVLQESISVDIDVDKIRVIES